MGMNDSKRNGGTKPMEWKLTDDAIEQLTATRERIMRGRCLKDDSTDIVRRYRDSYEGDKAATAHGSS